MVRGGHPLVIATACIAGGLFGVVWAIRYMRLLARVRYTARSRIKSMAVGPVEVRGAARTDIGQILISPFGKERCLYFEYELQERQRTNKSTHWVTIDRGSSRHIPLRIAEENSEVAVDLENAKVICSANRTHYLSDWGVESETSSFLGGSNARYRAKERFIPEHSQAYVLGSAQIVPTKEILADTQHSLATLMRQVKNRPDLMKRLDRNGDGTVDYQEWEWARNKLEARMKELVADLKGQLRVRASKFHPLLVTDWDEYELVRYLRNRVLLGMIGGLALIFIGVYILERQGVLQ